MLLGRSAQLRSVGDGKCKYRIDLRQRERKCQRCDRNWVQQFSQWSQSLRPELPVRRLVFPVTAVLRRGPGPHEMQEQVPAHPVSRVDRLSALGQVPACAEYIDIGNLDLTKRLPVGKRASRPNLLRGWGMHPRPWLRKGIRGSKETGGRVLILPRPSRVRL
jgi:hypothetical protein